MGTLGPVSRFGSISSQANTDCPGWCSAPLIVPYPVRYATAASSRATTYIGYSRNSRLVQNPRTDPLRSSEAGMMYPLTRKNTKTPYWPRSSQR